MVPNYAPSKFIPVRGQGARVWDQDGRDFIDLAGGIAVNSLGHAHPILVEALTKQAHKLWHLSNVFTNEPALRLAQKLVDATFAERVFFCNSGAEANEASLKLARRVAYDVFGPEKNEIIAAQNSFHGRTLFTVTVAGQPKYSDGFGPKIEGITHVPFNNIEKLQASISDKTCAVILEPIQGEGGILPADKAYLQAARKLCDEHNALLIFDEVQTGIGRTGTLFAYQSYGITPDILSSAKGLGGGFPIGAMLTTTEIAKHFTVGTHGTTYGGNPLACSVSEAVLSVVDSNETYQNINKMHHVLKSSLENLGKKYNIFTEIRGMGLLLGCVLAESWKGRAKEIVKIAAEEGVMILQAGVDVVRFAPSLVITNEELSEGLLRFEKSLAKLQENLS
ncbi:UNVERIFIED_CONTAM: hypothetical protein GTU68_040915 [Idotea baltica]|nr:hypothetical protein [Idotea baltica]